MSDATDNPKPFSLNEGDAIGFEKGRPVPIAPFDFEILDAADTARGASRDWAEGFLTGLKFIGAGTNPERRLRLMEFALGISTAKNQRELAQRLSITPAATSQQLTALKKDLAQIQRLMADQRRAGLNFRPLSPL